jgi:hypothetical protein
VGANPKGKTTLGRKWSRGEENITFGLREIKLNGVYMIKLVTERDKWHTLVNMLRKIRFCKMQDISRLSEQLLGFQRLCSKQ